MYSREEARQIRLEFWDRFKNYSAVRRRQKGLPAKWMMNNTGIRQLKLKFDFTDNAAITGIDIETRNEDRRLELFSKLEELRTLLEKALGQEMKWELDFPLPNGKSISRVYVELPGKKIYNKDDWPEIFPFFYKNMLKIETFFKEYKEWIRD